MTPRIPWWWGPLVLLVSCGLSVASIHYANQPPQAPQEVTQ